MPPSFHTFCARVHLLIGCSLVVLAGDLRAQRDQDGERWEFVPVAFFPPTPPIYGAAIENRPPGSARVFGGRRLTSPDGMADFISESFYPALSTRLFAPVLSSKLETALEDYRTKRRIQINALLDQLVALHDASPSIRERELRSFADIQTPQLVALEAEAETLRDGLIADGLWNRIDWNAGRKWRLGALKSRNDWVPLEAEFQVVRAAAYYQKGLIPQQRGLLRELAMELQPLAMKARGLPTQRTESDAMFFSPETARFRLPPDLSADLREKIARYNSQKAVLKRQLRDAITENDGASPAKRAQTFESLAESQWPHLGILEQLAEEIRGELATRPEGPPPAAPWIPGGLMEAIRSYNEDRDTYFGELRNRVEAAVSVLPKPDLNVSSDERVRLQREFMTRQAEVRREAALEFQTQNQPRYVELERRYRGIREALTIVAEKQTDRATGHALNADTLLRQYGAAMAEFDVFGRQQAIYSNYRTAMLQPGLSPEQRRLLFGYALVGLAQPLPYGELIPRRVAAQPYPAF